MINKDTQRGIPMVCGNCRFWIKETGFKATRKREIARCMRNPPTIIHIEDADEFVSKWPETTSIERCGEFKIREDA